MKITVQYINKQIKNIARAEKVTKERMRSLSRDILEYVMETHDVGAVNRLLDVLTPINRKTAIHYFKNFLPFKTVDSQQGEFQHFGSMKKKQFDAKKEEIDTFLSDPLNNIWTWAERNVDVEKKPFNVTRIGKIVEKALKEEVSQTDIISEVLKAGVEPEAIMQVLRAMHEEA